MTPSACEERDTEWSGQGWERSAATSDGLFQDTGRLNSRKRIATIHRLAMAMPPRTGRAGSWHGCPAPLAACCFSVLALLMASGENLVVAGVHTAHRALYFASCSLIAE